jgi:rhodanese-related sulfurtransferase
MFKFIRPLFTVVACTTMCGVPSAWADDKPVGITANLAHIDVQHAGKTVRIERNPDNFAMIDPDMALTSRPCPPYCIQPMVLTQGVETLGELEVLDYLRRADPHVLLIDSREPEWIERLGQIPGAINIPWQHLHPQHTSGEKMAEMLEDVFSAYRVGNIWNFSSTKTLVFYCNGPWCGQSPTTIRQLLGMGYPAHKIKWYRGGVQDWMIMGLTVVKPTPTPTPPQAK